MKDRRRKTRAAAATAPLPADDRTDAQAERRLIEAAQRDPRRFADLYEDNFERVYGFIARRVGDRDQAQDLTADVFHRALANLSRFQWRGVPFSAWLLRIAANAITDRGKRVARFEALALLEPGEPAAQPEFEEIEYRARLFKLVSRLANDQRRVITMRFARQKTIGEIALELGRSDGAIKQLQFRALQNLRTMLSVR